jgi:hypothetical protein
MIRANAKLSMSAATSELELVFTLFMGFLVTLGTGMLLVRLSASFGILDESIGFLL